MQKHIVRKSNIRGMVGIDFEVDELYVFTQAFLIWLERTTVLQKVAVGMDGRLHSSAIYHKVAQAIVDAGHQVYFVGVCPTPVLVHSLYALPVQAGIMITGSGSNELYNGLKLYVDKKPVEGLALQEIYAISAELKKLDAGTKGKIVPCPIVEQYLESIWQEFAHLSQYDFSMVLDVGSGVTGAILQKLIQKMGWKQVVMLHEQIDGSFPFHVPDPADYKNLELLKQQMSSYKNSFGIAFDGDGDRLAVVDEKMIIISPERMIVIFARNILAKHAHGKIAHDIVDSAWLDYALDHAQGKVIAVKDDQQPFFSLVEASQALCAGQRHGKFYFKDRHHGYPDAIYAFLRLLDILVQERCMVHDLLVKLPKQIVGYMPQTSTVEQNYQG